MTQIKDEVNKLICEITKLFMISEKSKVSVGSKRQVDFLKEVRLNRNDSY